MKGRSYVLAAALAAAAVAGMASAAGQGDVELQVFENAHYRLSVNPIGARAVSLLH